MQNYIDNEEAETLNHNMQNYIDDNEEAETLSLCDLSLSNNESSSRENQSSSSSSASSSLSINQDLFEFFSGGWSTSAPTTISPDHIIFCGKTIPSKQSILRNDQFFRRNSDSSFYKRSKSHSSSNVTTPPRSNSLPSPIHMNNSLGKLGGKNDIFIKRGASLSSVTKSRWFLFMFGNMTSVPKKMELSDLRSRESWGGPARMFRSNGGGDEEVVSRGHHATTVWKSTFSCFGGL